MHDAPIHVVDDAEDVRESLAILLDVAGFRCRTYGSAIEFLGVVRPGWTGCVVADVRMPGMTGIELQKELLLRGIRLPVVIITAHADVPMAVAALKAGAVEFIEKPFRDEVLIAAVRDALAGDTPRKAVASARFASLTSREREILDLLVAGHSSKAIAAILGISPRTVDVHRAHIMDKAKVNTIADLVRLACRDVPERSAT